MVKKWWNEKVAYQIYPKSFYDTNGDGIGDLRGVIEKLDYLKDLGVDIIWLSPCYRSPLADQGYDISDYYDIDPRFGTMADMDELIAEAKKRDMYILMDLVVNHCSDEHEWFKKACEDPDGKYGNFFYIEDRKEGELPCNWRSYFGGSVWEPLPGHPDKQYLHVFHKKQPDLNWENPEVREEVYKNINWWLDRGVSGFRIDAIINIKKKLPFKDYPVDRPDGLSSIHYMLEDATGVGEFLGEMRDHTFKPHDAFSVGEVFNEKEEELPDFIGSNGYFSSMFDFSTTVFGASPNGWYDHKEITPEDYKECCFHSQKRIGDIGYLSNIIENHDEPRGVSHYIPDGDLSLQSKKFLAAMYFMLRGLPFIYQGQEIGMTNCIRNDISEYDDISTKDQYQVAIDAGCSREEALRCCYENSRDNARTPMQWTDDENAGFTDGTPWLAMNPNYRQINVREQEVRTDSVLAYYRRLVHLRKADAYRETFTYGIFEPAYQEMADVFAYYRVSGESGQRILVAANFGTDAVSLPLAYPCRQVLLSNLRAESAVETACEKANALTLESCEVAVIELG